MELEGKELGCWCKPSPCHGDILIKLLKERQGANPYSSKFISTLENGENIVGQRNGLLDTAQSISSVGGDTPCGKDLSMKTPDVFTPLRLNGGGDTSHESQENMDNIEYLSNWDAENRQLFP